ncbi:MAG: FtsQ-type POTRA domain-containing protein [Clostridiales bacterium]|nr:FtsQ-type POTRA domain-containing protein [Clostridiales bacterium]
MDDEELKKLFEDDSEPEEVTSEKPKKEKKTSPEVKAPKKQEVKKQEAPKKAKPSKPTEPFGVQFKRFVDTSRRKISETIKNIKAAQVKKRQESGPKVPLKDRKFLPNFPLNFRGTLVLLLGISIIVLILAVIFLPFFRVHNIEVNGNIVLSDEKIIRESGIKFGSHLFSKIAGDPIDLVKMDYGKIEDKMKAEDPYIKDIQITVKFPSTIKIDVTERNKVAYIKMPDGYAAIDNEGIVIELVTLDKDDLSHAVICGLDVSGAVMNQKIVIKDEADYNKALVVLGAIITADGMGNADEYSLFQNVKEIRIIPGGNIFLTIELPSGSELQVKLKTVDTINEDMRWLRFAIISGSFEGLPDGAFDMTGDEYIYRMYSS